MTRDTYDALAEQWSRAHAGSGFWREEMAAFNRLLPGGKILEIGSGGGRDAKELIAMGYDYVGTDISSSMIEIARRENPGATFIREDVRALESPEGRRFDGFWASAVLLHIPKRSVGTALARIRACLRNAGIGFISLKQGNREGMEEQLTEGQKGSRFFAYYSEEEFTAILKQSGFEVVELTLHPAGATTWLCFLVRVVTQEGPLTEG